MRNTIDYWAHSSATKKMKCCEYNYPECHYTQYHYTLCCKDKCHYVKCYITLCWKDWVVTNTIDYWAHLSATKKMKCHEYKPNLEFEWVSLGAYPRVVAMISVIMLNVT